MKMKKRRRQKSMKMGKPIFGTLLGVLLVFGMMPVSLLPVRAESAEDADAPMQEEEQLILEDGNREELILTGEEPEEESEEDDWVGREFLTDGELHMGYSGCYFSAVEYERGELCWGGTPEEMIGVDPILFVHGNTIQEVIDKLDGTTPITVYDNDGNPSQYTVSTLKTDYIHVNVSTTNYIVEQVASQHIEQYITSTRSFKGIFLVGWYENQLTNHPKEGNYYVEDIVNVLTDDAKNYLITLKDSYGLDMNGVDISTVSHVSCYGDDIYVANYRSSVDAEHPYRYDLGAKITDTDSLWEAIGDYNEAHPDDEIDLDYHILNWDNVVHINQPFSTMHINSECDFKIAGMYSDAGLQSPRNPEGVNIFFGYLPDTNHTLTFLVDNEEGEGWHEVVYSRESLNNGALKGIVEVQLAHSVDGSVAKVQMYQHAASSSVSSVAGDDFVVMDATAKSAKVLRDMDITKEQLEALESGGTVSTDLKVEAIDIQTGANQTVAADMEQAMNKNHFACENPAYFDLSLSASIRDASGQKIGTSEGITELEDSVTLTITLPEQVKPQQGIVREYAVVRRHVTSDNQVQTEMISTKFNSTTSALTFQTDRFSTYAIVYRDTASTTDGSATNTTATGKTPATGDSGVPYAVLLLLLLSGAGCITTATVMKSNRK